MKTVGRIAVILSIGLLVIAALWTSVNAAQNSVRGPSQNEVGLFEGFSTSADDDDEDEDNDEIDASGEYDDGEDRDDGPSDAIDDDHDDAEENDDLDESEDMDKTEHEDDFDDAEDADDDYGDDELGGSGIGLGLTSTLGSVGIISAIVVGIAFLSQSLGSISAWLRNLRNGQ